MPKAKSIFSFTAPLDSVKGAFISTVIYIPEKLMKTLPKGRQRVKGTMNKTPFALAIQYRKQGKSFFIVSSILRKAARIKPGDPVKVEFTLQDPDKVDLPQELQAVLSQDEEARQAWKTITPGMQRNIVIYIRAVKNVDSRINRAIISLNKVKQGQFTKREKRKPDTNGD